MEGKAQSSSSSSVFFALMMLLKLAVITSSMEMDRVLVPRYETVHNSAKLYCQFSLGQDRLYSVKWYKDGSEFYRFVPKDNPPIQVFDVIGIHVNEEKSNARLVTISDLRLTSSGTYTCEASSEGPRFKTISGQGIMNVLDLPDTEPQIRGLNSSGGVKVGSWLQTNCSSPNSRPPVNLKWYINNEQVNPLYLSTYSPTLNARSGLYTSHLGLSFKLKRQHFIHGVVTLKCTAKLHSHYFESSQKHLNGIGLGEKALESRANDSDKLKNCSSLLLWILLYSIC